MLGVRRTESMSRSKGGILHLWHSLLLGSVLLFFHSSARGWLHGIAVIVADE